VLFNFLDKGISRIFEFFRGYLTSSINASVLFAILGAIPIDEMTLGPILSRMSNGFVHFQYLENNQEMHRSTKCYLKPVRCYSDIPFFDEETDCIVLEIEPCQDVARFPMPEPFTLFSPAVGKFDLIGHTGGDPKACDTVTDIVDPSDDRTKADITFLKQQCDVMKQQNEVMMRNNRMDSNRFVFDYGDHNNALNEKRILFHCNSSKGASGAPGIQVLEDGRIVVVTMLLHGYPDWYYDKQFATFTPDWPKIYCIEQGTVMREVYLKMLAKKPELCTEVFP